MFQWYAPKETARLEKFFYVQCEFGLFFFEGHSAAFSVFNTFWLETYQLTNKFKSAEIWIL